MRKATNSVTGESLVVRNVINETVDSARLDVLRALGNLSEPVSQAGIVERSSISRQTVSTHLAVLRDRGFIKSHEMGIEITAGGKVLLETIEECLQTTSEGELAFLTRSEHPIKLLLALHEEAYRTSELQTAVSSSPSRSTVGRLLEFLIDHDWTRDEAGHQQITYDGRRVLMAYDELSASVEQIIDKAAWLQRLPPDDATFPVRELADAKVVISDTKNPSNVLWAALKLCDLRTSRFRGFCSIYNPILFHTYKVMLDFGIEAEAILDKSTYEQASQNERTKYAARASEYPHYQPMCLEESHTLGIGIYDDRKVAIGAYNERGRGQHIAMIISSNEALIEWGIGLYTSYREKAREPSAESPVSDSPSPVRSN